MAIRNRKLMLRMVTAPRPATAIPPDDPIYAVIEAHQKARRGYIELNSFSKKTPSASATWMLSS